MSEIDVIRAWKDDEYRQSLSEGELAALPADPAGPMELRDEDLAGAAGAVETFLILQCDTCRCDWTTWTCFISCC